MSDGGQNGLVNLNGFVLETAQENTHVVFSFYIYI